MANPFWKALGHGITALGIAMFQGNGDEQEAHEDDPGDGDRTAGFSAPPRSTKRRRKRRAGAKGSCCLAPRAVPPVPGAGGD